MYYISPVYPFWQIISNYKYFESYVIAMNMTI